ncbi:host specificity protein J [Salmonella enterica subsp. enterica serovar Newport]|nr:host specificity protein J [Salmonella enterica subsp. enterica serovar Newport]
MSKGGGGGHTPYEAPDSLKSTQLLAMIDAISEGPIKGPVNGMQSILVNNTPLVDADGNYNIHGVTVVYRLGEHPQTALDGFEDSGAETLMGVELKHDNPITRTITSKEIDRLRFTFGVQSLVESNDKGDQNESSVNMQIQFQINGVWQLVKDIYIHGKTTTQFLASVVVSNLPPRPFNMRMVRITDDSTTSMLQNKTLWSSYTEIIDIKQTYPNTAVVGLQVDAEQFGSQQVTVNYHLEGRTVLVPSNYDPVSRTYAGLWDGTFKPAYTNNPAWCVLDLLTHPRYGMGQRIGISDVDKWALYVIAQYCDQMVPDGFGGMEPRMRCNAWLTTQRKAHDVLADFCSVMRCMPVWNGQKMTFVQDRPADRVWTYTNSNVVGGQFKYSFSALKERHNAVEVRYVDPMNGWKTSTELVEDRDAQVRYGRNVLKMDAFGCTSRGQAHRMGLWAIQTELLETQTVDFSVGAEGLRHTVGDLFEICDNDYAGASVSGRIVAVDVAARTLTLDREVEIPERGAATLSTVGSDGLPVIVKVMSHAEPDKITVDILPEGIEPGDVWGLKLPALRRRLFRCVVIREGENGTYGITAVQHVPEKEVIVDNGAHFDLQSGTLNGVIPPAVQHLAVDTSADSSLYQAKATWDTPRVIKGVRFILRLTVGAGTDDDPVRLVTTVTTSETEFTFHELPYGHYTLTVSAINGYGQQGDPASVEFDIDLPEPPDFIEITPGYFSLTVAPRQKVYHPDVSFEFWFSEKQLLSADQVLAEGQYLGRGSMWIKDGLMLLGTDYWFYVRSVNLVGKSAFAEASGQVKSDAEGVLDLIKGQITANLLNREFLGTIDNEVVKSEFEKALQLSEENVQQQLTELKKEFGDDVAARIQKLEQVISGPDGSIGQKIEQINAALGKQSVTVEEISKAQATLNDAVAAIKSFKVQYQANGQAAIAGIQLSATQEQSQILMMADRIAFLNPQNGSVALPFVIQNGQIILAESFVKSLNVNGRVIVTPDGEFTMRANPTRNVGLVLNSRGFTIFDEQSRPRFEAGELY